MKILKNYQRVSRFFLRNKLVSVLVSVIVCFALIAVALLIYFIYHTGKDATSVEWELRGKSKTKGSALYVLKKYNSSKRFFITTERVLSEKSYSTKEGYLMELYSVDDYWDPNTCAKMPSVITKDYIYTLESVKNKNTGIIETSVIRFDINRKILESVAIPDSKRIIGTLFLFNDNPSFITFENGKVGFATIENNSIKYNKTNGMFVDALDKKPTIFMKQNVNRNVYLEYMKQDLKRENYLFDPKNKSFTHLDFIQERDRFIFYKNHKTVLSKNSDDLYFYNLQFTADINVYDELGEEIIIWNNPMEEITKYIIGTI